MFTFSSEQLGSSPRGHVDHTDHAGQQDSFEQPGLRVHVDDGAHASEHGGAEQELQKDLEDTNRRMSPEITADFLFYV